MGKDGSRLPLTAAQRASARRYPWYRRWLLSTGRSEAEVDGTPPPRPSRRPREERR